MCLLVDNFVISNQLLCFLTGCKSADVNSEDFVQD